MYRIVFSFRAKEGCYIGENDCAEAAKCLYDGFKTEGYIYFKRHEHLIKPMVQLTAGTHCNIEELDVGNHDWTDTFKPEVELDQDKMTPSKKLRIAPNFIKIEFITKGTGFIDDIIAQIIFSPILDPLPFRVPNNLKDECNDKRHKA